MKRFLQRLSLLLAVLLLLTTAVFADFGPKPQLVVRVEQPPQEEYYLDLLDTGDWAKNLYDLDERELDPALLAALRAAVPSGWHACIAQGSTRAPIWGELTGEPGRLRRDAAQLPLLRRSGDIPHSDGHGLRRDVFVGCADAQDAAVLRHGRAGRRKRQSRLCSPWGICCNSPRRLCRRF